jgi:hypothetical protein
LPSGAFSIDGWPNLVVLEAGSLALCAISSISRHSSLATSARHHPVC